MICAPAGFGKTTFMHQWQQQLVRRGVCTAWLSLDEGDNEPDRFLSHLFAAIRKVLPDRDLTISGRLEMGPTELRFAGGVLYLLDQLAQLDAPFALLLDGFEVLQNQVVLQMVRQYLQYLPRGTSLVMTTRRSPEIGLGKIRARGELLEIDQECLRFSLEQTRRFVRQSAYPDISEEDIGALHRKTEGWVTGLQLLLLSGGGTGCREKEKSAETGYCLLTSYLVEDVLAQQPEKVQNFLLQTSVLSRLSAPLCASLTGDDNSYQMLEYLDDANLFLVPIDEDRGWYRYHSLFGSFLRNRLVQMHPDRLPGLHLAASEWYFANGEIHEAAEHSLAAQELERTAGLLEVCAFELVTSGLDGILLRVGQLLPVHILEQYPKLLACYAWALAVRERKYEKAVDVIRLAKPESWCYPGYEIDLRLLSITILVLQDRIAECDRKIDSVLLRQCFVQKPLSYGVLLNLVGYLEVTEGKFSEALEHFGEAYRFQNKNKGYHGILYVRYHEGTRERALGRLQGALSIAETAMKEVGNGPLRYSAAGTALAVLLAEGLYERGELEEAEKLLGRYRSLLPLALPADVVIIGYRTLARIHAAKGDFVGGMSCLAEFERLGIERDLPRVAASSRLEQARFALLRGDLHRAQQLQRKCSDDPIWGEFKGRNMPANDPETIEINRLRLMIALGRGENALKELEKCLKQAMSCNRYLQALLIRILMAKAYESCKRRGQALQVLKKAVHFAQDEGFVRIFADEGGTLSGLLAELARTLDEETSREYAGKLLLAAGPQGIPEEDGRATTGDGPYEALTGRELSLLKLLAQGLSNEALGDQLCISINTVRSHLRNINSKLGAGNRTEAVSLARNYGMI